jgi:sister-chromatid-cohesion protein PDS5
MTLMAISSEKNNPTAISQFGWIPGQLVDTAGVSPEFKVLAEDVISRYILPLPSVSGKADIDEDDWTRRLLRVVISGGSPRVLESILLMSGLKSA